MNTSSRRQPMEREQAHQAAARHDPRTGGPRGPRSARDPRRRRRPPSSGSPSPGTARVRPSWSRQAVQARTSSAIRSSAARRSSGVTRAFPRRPRPVAVADPADPAALDQQLGDLDGVRRGALAQVVAHHPEREAPVVRRRTGPGGPGPRTRGRSRPRARQAGRRGWPGRPGSRHRGRSPSTRVPRAGVMGAFVSTWTASEWLMKTGTRTAVQETRRSGRCRILRLSVTTFHSSLV